MKTRIKTRPRGSGGILTRLHSCLIRGHSWTIAACLVLAAALPCAAQPTAAVEAERMPAHLAAVSSTDPAERAAAMEWLMNTSPASLPLIEIAAKNAQAGSTTAAELDAALAVLRPLDALRAAYDQKRKEHLEWVRSRALEEYEQVGTHNPSWDALARRGIAKAVSHDPGDEAEAFEVLEHLTGNLGCRDPLILLLDAQHLNIRITQPHRAKLMPCFSTYVAACRALDASNYPARQKVIAMGQFLALADQYLFAESRPDIGKWLGPLKKKYEKRMLELWPEVLKEPGQPFSSAFYTARLVIEGEVKGGVDRKQVLDAVLPPLAAAYPNHPGVAALEAEQIIAYAWDARGRGWANTVTDQGWRLMHERLMKAKSILETSYAAHPLDPAAPLLMLRVGLGESYDVRTMKLWFDRAVRTNPDRKPPAEYVDLGTAYDAMEYALQPKWLGSEAEMLAFGRRCLAGRNWRGWVPFELVAVHQTLSTLVPDAAAYFRRPDVWADLDAVTGGALRVWPDDARLLSMRAYWSWKCGKWAEADKAFEAVGDRASEDLFGGPAALDTARAESAEKSAAPAE